MDHIEAVFQDEGILELQGNCEQYLVTIDGCKTAWMKHQQLLEIGNSPPAEQSVKAKILKGYDSWDFSQGVNQPLHESELVKGYDSWDFFQGVNQPLCELVEGLNADQLMIDLGLDASDLLHDWPVNRLNESESLYTTKPSSASVI